MKKGVEGVVKSKKIFNVRCAEYHSPEDLQTIPKEGYFITFLFYPHPQLVWSDRPDMLEYLGKKTGILLGAGVFKYGSNAVEEIKKNRWASNTLHCRAQFDTLAEAQSVFDRTVAGGFSDIYLYADGKQIAKFD